VDDEGQQGEPEESPADSAPTDPPPPQDSTPADPDELPDLDLEWDFRGTNPEQGMGLSDAERRADDGETKG
jgi:hypothetical protein